MRLYLTSLSTGIRIAHIKKGTLCDLFNVSFLHECMVNIMTIKPLYIFTLSIVLWLGTGGIIPVLAGEKSTSTPCSYYDFEGFVTCLYEQLYHRPADTEGLHYWTLQLESGNVLPHQVLQSFVESNEFQQVALPIARLYLAALNREPDISGLHYWMTQHANGLNLQQIASFFLNSSEFSVHAGAALSDGAYVTHLYRQILNRDPDVTGLTYWQAQLQQGLSRAALLTAFSAAEEFHNRTQQLIPILLYISLINRLPTMTELNELTSLQDAVQQVLHARFQTQPMLIRFRSEAAFKQYLRNSLETQTDQFGPPPAILTGFPEVDFSVSSGRQISSTNLQEQDVDEADRIKTDGRYLYVIEDSDYTSTLQPHLRILEMANAPEQAIEVGRLALSTDIVPRNAYLLTADTGPRLVTLGEGGIRFWRGIDVMPLIETRWFAPWFWQQGRTEITFIDLATPAQPRQTSRLTFDGHLISSRRINQQLHLVLRYMPMLSAEPPVLVDRPVRTQTVDDQNKAEDLLPQWYLNGVAQGALVQATDCYRPPMQTPLSTADMIVIVTVQLDQPDAIAASRCLIGATEAIYASTQALYLATTQYRYVQPDTQNQRISYPPEVSTELHKFSFADGTPEYRGSGRIPGHLGWEPDKKSFRMGEHDGILRVATSLGEDWDGSATTRLSLLAEAADGTRLEEIAYLPNAAHPEPLGKPGERLYAARFIGERGYLVTFRVTDPLYVLDLSQPRDPKIAASLEIAGYSDYLHLIDDRWLLGVGKDARPDTTSETAGDGRGAWYQGVKIALFDVRDPAAIREVASQIIGQRGTDAGVLYDHHALAYLPADADSGRPARVAIPIRVHGQEQPVDLQAPSWTYYSWTASGLYLFEIHSDTTHNTPLLPRAPLIVERATHRVSWDTADITRARAVLRADGVHYLHGNHVWSATWGHAETLRGPQ